MSNVNLVEKIGLHKQIKHFIIIAAIIFFSGYAHLYILN